MAEGTRFKTGYLAPRISFSALGASIGEDIAQTAEAISAERQQKKALLNQQMGFTKSLEETTPAGLNNKFVNGAQLALERYQTLATTAYASGNGTDRQAYLSARKDYIDFVNVASSKSAMNNATRTNIMNGNIKDMLGTRQENLGNFAAFDQADYEMQGGQLMVMEAGAWKPWKETNIADMNNVFVPAIEWEGTKLMPEAMGSDIYTTRLKNNETGYQGYYPTGFRTGGIDEQAVYNDTQEELENRFLLNPQASAEAIAVIAYRTINAPEKAELSEEDIEAARGLYGRPEFYTELEGQTTTVLKDGEEVSLTDGSFNADGEYVLTATDEDLKKSFGAGWMAYRRPQRAYAVYMEQAAGAALNGISRVDETRLHEAAMREEEMAKDLVVEEAAIESQEAFEALAAQINPYNDTLLVTETVEGEIVERGEVEAILVPASVKGREFSFVHNDGKDSRKVGVVDLIFDPDTGEHKGFVVIRGKVGMLDEAIDFENQKEYSRENIMLFDEEAKGTSGQSREFYEIEAKFLSIVPGGDRPTGAQLINFGSQWVKTSNTAAKEEDDRRAKADESTGAGAAVAGRAMEFAGFYQRYTIRDRAKARAFGDWITNETAYMEPAEVSEFYNRILEDSKDGKFPTIVDGDIVWESFD